MSINDVSVLVNIIIKVVLLGFFIFGTIYVYKKNINTILDMRSKKLYNEKIKLYSTIDPKLVKLELINLIKDYTARYMTKNIMVNHIDFIKNDQMEAMVKDITRTTILEMSDLYLNYCKLLYAINTEDDLTEKIYYLVVDVVLDVVTEFNKQKG